MTQEQFEELYGRTVATAFMTELGEIEKRAAEDAGAGAPAQSPGGTSDGVPPGPSLTISGPAGGAQPAGPAPVSVQQPKAGAPSGQQYQQSYKGPVGTATYKKTW